jgi:DNA-binding winged helix-turn-helix (wHTH) protein/TolB-like protein
MVAFGPFTFDPDSGELRRGDEVIRLTPQTAQVLQVLLERAGLVVSRNELRERIWPDTTVEFDQGLSFCVRQLRIALGDSAGEPTYIETLPKRGYRFVARLGAPTPIEPAAPVSAPEPPPRIRSRRRSLQFGAALFIVALALGLLPLWYRHTPSPPNGLAIVPYDADGEVAELTSYRDALADGLVERVTTQTIGSVAVMGPSTTRGFGSRTMVDSIRERTGASWVLSGVVRQNGEFVEVFSQLIRASDRAHVWVARWPDSSGLRGGNPTGLAARIADSVSGILLHPNAPRRLPH